MGLRVQNNIEAMDAHKNLLKSTNQVSKSLERLSSGYRINRAADDAAGLSISSSFNANIESLKVAQRNASEASSMLQVGEGAADKIESMLVRLKQLATQAASANSGSNLDKINDEKEKLLEEIDKIANSTEYAGVKLINGTYGVGVSATGGDVTVGNGFNSLTGMKAGYSYVIDVVDTAGGKADIKISMYDASGTVMGDQTVYDATIPSGGSTTAVKFNGLGLEMKINKDLNETTFAGNASSMVVAKDSGNATFQVGAKNDSDNQISISLGDLTTNSGLGISSIDLSSASTAQTAITTLETALNSLLTVRGNIGSYMNQLDYHAKNLESTIQNQTAAMSVIKDADMAEEMMGFTKNQILQQSGMAMLSQANQAPQMLLSLFQ